PSFTFLMISQSFIAIAMTSYVSVGPSPALALRSRPLPRRSSRNSTARRCDTTSMSLESTALSVAVAIAAGLVGSFAVMRKMSLAADPLSHIALPGIVFAIALHAQPIFGATLALLAGAVLVWILEKKAHTATESIIGVVFSAALPIGSLTTSGENLIHALFVNAGVPSP